MAAQVKKAEIDPIHFSELSRHNMNQGLLVLQLLGVKDPRHRESLLRMKSHAASSLE